MGDEKENLALGSMAKDKVSGFVGMITAKARYMAGNSQSLLAPPVDKDGKFVDPVWFDDARLVEQPEAAGIPRPAPPTATDKTV